MITGADWDASQWASIERSEPVDEVTKWTLWRWVSTSPDKREPIDGRGENALSGSGHNPSGQRWAVDHDTRS
jgi:hypothetical protein